MKNLLILILTLAITPTYAQLASLNISAKAGVNYSSYVGKGPFDDSRVAYHFGLMLEIPFPYSDKFSLQPELLYSAQGTAYKNHKEFESTYDGTINTSNLNVPMMFKYYTGGGLYIEAGPQLNLSLSQKDVWENVNTGETGEHRIDNMIYANISTVYIDTALGLGYIFNNGLSFGVRYNFGWNALTYSTYLDENYDVEIENKIHNPVIQAYIGFIIFGD